LTTSQVLPSRINEDNVRGFGQYSRFGNNHGYYTDYRENNANAKREGRSDFLTIFKNHFENTIIMYLDENDVAKLKDIKINFSAMCVEQPDNNHGKNIRLRPCNEFLN